MMWLPTTFVKEKASNRKLVNLQGPFAMTLLKVSKNRLVKKLEKKWCWDIQVLKTDGASYLHLVLKKG